MKLVILALSLTLSNIALAQPFAAVPRGKFQSSGCDFSDTNAKIQASNAAVRRCGKQGFVYRVSEFSTSWQPGTPDFCTPGDFTCVPSPRMDTYCASAWYTCQK